MKNNIRFFKLTGIITCFLLLLFSCKKDNGDIKYSQRPGSRNLFLSISGTGNLNRTQQISTVSTGTANTSVGLNLTLAAPVDINAMVGIDTAKVKSYNAANGTQFYLLPTACYSLQEPASGLTVKAGQLFSADSVKISFKNLTGLRGSNYILPVSITKMSGDPSVILSDSVKTVYLQVTLTDVKQPTVSINTASGSTVSLTYPVGQTGAATASQINIQIAPTSPDNITVNTAVDTSLISKYGSGYSAFPAGTYQFSSASVIIPSGQSSASLSVKIADLSKFDYTKVYLLPVSITGVSGDSFASIGSKTVYVKLSFSNLNNGNNTKAAGTSLVNRNAWAVSASSAFDGTIYGGTNYPASNTTDGNLKTDWVSGYNGQNSTITFDMGTTINVKTIAYNKALSNILGAYGIDAYPGFVNIYTSTDGINWASQGSYQPISDSGSPSYDPGTNYINFYNAIKARYMRLEIPYGTGFSEVNVYQ